MTKKWFKLVGVTRTPLISKRRRFGIGENSDIGVVIHGRPRVFGKIKKGEKRAPKVYRGFFGEIEAVVPSHKLEEVLNIEQIGRYGSEGMGLISWVSAIELTKKPINEQRRIKIRKMLPKLNIAQEKLVIAMLLHDLVHNPRHNSKIYRDVEVTDADVYELAVNHHDLEKTNEIPMLSLLQYYDQLSARINRRFRWYVSSRYLATQQETIDFEVLKKEIESCQYSPYKLYAYVYKSKTLRAINEALRYGFSSLRNHLLMMVTLYIRDWQDGVLCA